MIQVAVLFEKFAKSDGVEMIEWLVNVTNPSCLQRTHKWPPTIEELSKALEAESIKREQVRRDTYVKRPRNITAPPRPERVPGYRANIRVFPESPQFAAVEAFTKLPNADPHDWRRDGDCIWISVNAWHDLYSTLTRGSSWTPISDAEQRATYGRREAEASAERAAEQMMEDHRGRS